MKNCFFIMLLLLDSLPVLAQQCETGQMETTPDKRFILAVTGTATDSDTGLMWMRCALGQTWRDQRCAFSHLTYDFSDASVAVRELNRRSGFAGYHDWRMPTIEELQTIIEQRCTDPAINLTVFPDTPTTGYWSSTPDPDYYPGAMLVHLLAGKSYMGNKNVPWGLRLVRDKD